MRQLRVYIGSVDDVQAMFSDVPEGMSVKFDPAFAGPDFAKSGITCDDAQTILNFVVEFAEHVAEKVAADMLAKHLGKLAVWSTTRKVKAKIDGVPLPEDADERRRKLFELFEKANNE